MPWAERYLPPLCGTLSVRNVVSALEELSEEKDSSVSVQPRSSQILLIICLSEQPHFRFATAAAAVLAPLILPAPKWPASNPLSP